MKRFEKYTGEKVYMFPTGHLATKDAVLRDFPAALTFPHIIQTDANGEVMFACQNLSAMRDHYNIDPALSEEEAIVKIQEIANTPEQPQEAAPSELERIAAAMELQALSAMPDAE